jgi:hypothetical protein
MNRVVWKRLFPNNFPEKNRELAAQVAGAVGIALQSPGQPGRVATSHIRQIPRDLRENPEVIE